MTTVRDVVPPGAMLWAKADWEWRWEGRVVPFIAYSYPKTADEAAGRLKRDDLVLIVRVLDTVNSGGRPGLVEGLLQVNPEDRRPTTAYLPEEVIDAVVRKAGKFWPSAIGGTRTWEVLGDHNAADVLPRTRSRFSRKSGEKGLAPVEADELEAVLNLPVREVKPDVVPEAAAWLTLDKRRRVLAARAGRDVYLKRKADGLLPPESAREQASHERNGRTADIEDARAALKAQGDGCALCGGVFGRGPLRPVSIVKGGLRIVHAACNALERHAPGAIFEEGERAVAIKEVSAGQPSRDRRVPAIALGANLRRHGRLVCDSCGSDWRDHPCVTDDFVGALFEVHHRRKVSAGQQGTDPLADVVVVCALCHKLVHAMEAGATPKG